MEIIFTLILLIGFGINSHHIENRSKDFQKQEAVYVVKQQSDTNTNADVRNEIKKKEIVTDKSQDTVNDTSLKGKIISIRIGNEIRT